MNDYRARFVTEPTVVPLAQMALIDKGLDAMIAWCDERAPQCLPDTDGDTLPPWQALFPHDLTDGEGRALTHNELLVELAGRKCYNSFGEKAGKKSNRLYIEHTQQGDVPHASILYHAKISFFIAGVSRRVSHELIRNYVGADRDEEGSPSQESTRYVENAGFFIVPPRYLDSSPSIEAGFRLACDTAYKAYREMVRDELDLYELQHGERAKGIEYKRILEAASALLPHTVETSFIWTTNPMALAKLFKERDHDAADLEFRRFARKWKAVCIEHAPNLFPQSWMRS